MEPKVNLSAVNRWRRDLLLESLAISQEHLELVALIWYGSVWICLPMW